MHSLVAGAIVGALVTLLAVYKGRTGWHWLALSVFAFASVWLVSFVVLYAANVRLTLVAADRSLSEFAGAVTATTIVILLAWLPPRPRPHATPSATVPRRGTSD
ncbi:MAG TPA: hypothetical protein VLV50_10575 [Stellaceae bacterium]|nr:hypothetical protein [Stellaceae bacterium]